MKKSILTITLMTLVVSSFAQLPFTFDLGLKFGINSSKITTTNPSISGYTFSDFKSDAKSGFDFGAFARIGGKKIYLQPELLYCKRNGQSSFTTGTLTDIQKVDLKTIKIPILVGFKLLDLKLASIRAFTGPAMSFVTSGSNIKSEIVNLNPKNFKNNIWDWQLGAGVDVLKLTFDVRYEWGLSNLSDGGSITNIGFINKGNLLTLSVGFKFI
jgi:hypothetical protein